MPSYPTYISLVPSVRFTNKSDQLQVVTCSAQATAQLTAEVSDYDSQVCDGNIHHFQLFSHILLMSFNFKIMQW